MDLMAILGILAALAAGKAAKSTTKRLSAQHSGALKPQRVTAPLAVAAVSVAAAALGANEQDATQVAMQAGQIYAVATAAHSTGKNTLQLLKRLF